MFKILFTMDKNLALLSCYVYWSIGKELKKKSVRVALFGFQVLILFFGELIEIEIGICPPFLEKESNR